MIETWTAKKNVGSAISATPNEKGFARIEMLLEATGGLSLSQVCAVTGLEGSTIQNWVKRGWVQHPSGKKYEEVHVARILIINALKECIKLEHIVKLLSYVNGTDKSGTDAIIKESTLYSYLCEVLKQSGQSDDHSKSGVESVIDNVIRDYGDHNPDARDRIKKALTLMMFACVCTDVKRRTEAMMGQILKELEKPRQPQAKIQPLVNTPAPAETKFEIEEVEIETKPEPEPELDIPSQINEIIQEVKQEEKPKPKINPFAIKDEKEQESEMADDIVETRKTISQALREWDNNAGSSVEKVIIDYDATARKNEEEVKEVPKKPEREPWYVRKT